jgi:4-hydroxy-tetrahydrodipicolinate reductase
MNPAPISLMVNGLPGDMAGVVARHVADDERFLLLPYSLTGPEIEIDSVTVGSTTVELVGPDQKDAAVPAIRQVAETPICLDYTHPSAVNENASFYCRHGLPFVMGTTGGDRTSLEETVQSSATAAVIAPNMAKQIVGFQAMMAYAAETFPRLFEGYRLRVRESHQMGKADTSGTAKAMVHYFNRLGVPFAEKDIEKERDPQRQRGEWGIPEDYLSGHGWHTYALTSADGTVSFAFTHNVNGRDVYAAGTLDAAAFLAEKIRKGAKGKVFTMIDVLKG